MIFHLVGSNPVLNQKHQIYMNDQTNRVEFPSIEISKVSPRSDSSLRANSGCYHKSETWSDLKRRVISPI